MLTNIYLMRGALLNFFLWNSLTDTIAKGHPCYFEEKLKKIKDSGRFAEPRG